jgi:hypothetical protein
MQTSGPRSRLQFGAVNFGFLAGAALSLVGGYYLLWAGSTTAAPLLLVLGYCVLLPLGLIL